MAGPVGTPVTFSASFQRKKNLMKYSSFVSSALVALAVFTATPARADNLVSIGITPATGAVTLVPRWGIGGNLAGFHHMSQDLGLGGAANNFYSIKSTPIPAGGDILAFNLYSAGSGAATPHSDIGSKLTPNSYSALTSADPDVGFGSVNMYMIHHRGTTDYFTALIPGSGVSSAVTDLKPMSGPGGPGTVTGVSGYFGLTFAASNLGYGLNQFYYLRRDPITGFTKFGTLAPALLASSADQFDLGLGGHVALAFTGSDVGYGVDKMYYLRLDPITGFTILGMLDPALAGIRHSSDIANLGSVFTTLTFVPGDVGFGSSKFYATGAINPTWQSVSFAAIADRAIGAGSFTVTPSASSGLAIALTVVPGSVGAASISAPVGGVFTVTPTAPGLITLQATQAGQVAPTPFEFNMLRQSFTATGAALLAITTQPSSQSAAVGATVNFTVAANGTTPISYRWRKAGVDILTNATANTPTLTLTNVQASDAGSYDVAVNNASGSLTSTAAILTVTSPNPVITNSPLTAAGTVGTAFSFTITASGSPSSFTAAPLPAGLNLNTVTGAITGTPTAAGSTITTLTATNGSGTSSPATLTITVSAAAAAPSITSATTAPATVGSAFSYNIIATGSPTSYGATPLPAGVTLNATTGAITGTPLAAGTTVTALTATNATGTSSPVTLTITVAPAATAPIITSPTTAPGTAGTAFVTYTIMATGSPVSFGATGLPAGLVVNAATGTITGTPASAGVSVVTISATNPTGTGTGTLTITVAATTPPPIPTQPPVLSAPIIVSATTAPATAGTAFITYTIAATSLPTSYTATGLPAGLTLDALTGRITGTPTTPGVYNVVITAINNAGSGSLTLTITVAPATVAPIITSPTTAPGTVGTPFVTYLIAATGLPTSYTATGLPAGLSVNTLTGAINGTPTVAGTSFVTLTATNSAGVNTAPLTITIAPAAVAPIITSATNAPGTVGTPFATYLIGATGLPTSYTATGLPAGLTVNTLTGAINGTPTVSGTFVVTITATNALGTSTATLTIVIVPSSRIVNFSARAISGPGSQTLIMGFVVSGNNKNLLLRGIGPGLTAFGIANALADPLLTLFGPNGVVASNDDWQANTTTSATLMSAMAAQVGAFALANGSRDSSLLFTFNNGAHTTSMVRPNSTTGVALTEIYDTDSNATARLINVSARMNVSAGEGTLIAGLVIAGTGSKTVLVRGIGPTLAAFAVTGVLADPIITVYSGNTVVATNDNWETGTSTAAQISSASAQVGAFALTAGSRDAALLVALQPGNYTVHVTGLANSTGVALIEVYDTQ
jgi:hypothetical protein